MSTGSIRALLVTSYFPPISGAGVFRWYHFLKFLYPDVEFRVLTRKPETGEITDPSLLDAEDYVKDVIRIPSISPGALYRKFKKTGNDDGAGRGGSSGAVLTVQKLLQLPDQRVGEIPLLVQKIRKMVKEDKVDVVIATAPHYSYLVASAIAIRDIPRVKFLVDLRDPWSPAPLFPYVTGLHRKANILLEKMVLARADKIIVVNEEMVDLYGNVFPEFVRKMEVVYNGFSPEDKEFAISMEGKREEGKDLLVSFVGSLYAYRDPGVVVRGLARFLKERGGFGGRIVFAGELKPPWDVKLPEDIKNYGLGDFMELAGFLPRREALDLMRKSDALLHIVGDYPAGLSAKVFEYVYMGKPICVVGDRTGIVGRFLRRVDHPHMMCNNERDFVVFLEKLIAGELSSTSNRNILEYSRKAQADRLYRIIREVVGEDRRNKSR